MVNKFAILTLLAVVTFVGMPVASSVSAQQTERRTSRTWQTNDRQPNRRMTRTWRSRYQNRDNDRRRGTWKNTHGYRNYGQYRRTQVGNRRWNRWNRNTMRYNRTTRRYRRDQ